MTPQQEENSIVVGWYGLKITAIALAFLFVSAQAFANDCDFIKMKAYELQLDRQGGIVTDWQPETWLERDMKNAVFQQPQFRAESMRKQRARSFAAEWEHVCKAGYYPLG